MDAANLIATEEAAHFHRMEREVWNMALGFTQERERYRSLGESLLLVVGDYTIDDYGRLSPLRENFDALDRREFQMDQKDTELEPTVPEMERMQR